MHYTCNNVIIATQGMYTYTLCCREDREREREGEKERCSIIQSVCVVHINARYKRSTLTMHRINIRVFRGQR